MASIASNHANGASMSYGYDDLGRLSAVVDARLGTTTYTYDDANNVATVTYPNGVQTLMQYDTLNRVKALATQQTGYVYQRGPTGNLTSATESSGRTVNWAYDGIYRLTNEAISLAPSGKNGTVSYGLDPVGNRQSDTSSLSGISSGTWSFNADDELASETYDANGNVLFTGGRTFAYDSENHLTSMNGGAVQITYDAFGNRVAKSVNGVVTRYLVEDDVNPTGLPQVMEELNGAGAVTRTYTYGLQRIDENQLIGSTWAASFYGYDGGGNVRNLTNTGGTITDSYEYDAFGNEFTVSGSTPNNYLYRGEQFDRDLGLYYLRARYYNPTTGRFVSRDSNEPKPIGPFKVPFDPRKLHKYLYAGGDPVNWIDPRGLEAEVEYSERIEAPEAVSKFIATIGCGSYLGFYVAAATIDATAAWNNVQVYWPASTAVAVGCVYAFYPASLAGVPSLAVDIVGAVGCTAGIYQTDQDYNRVLADLSSNNTSAYSSDLSAFETDLVSSVFTCGITGIGGAWDIQRYFY